MNLWESIKKGAEDGLEILKDGASAFISKAGKTTRMTQKGVELTSVQRRLKKAFTRLGGLTYELHSKGEENIYGNEGIKALMAEIEGYEESVRKIAAEIETIKGEEREISSEKTSKTEQESSPPSSEANP